MANKPRRKKKGAKFIMLESYMINSPAWRDLSGDEVLTYLEMKWRYDGSNNGKIVMSCRDVGNLLKKSKNTGNKVLNGLDKHGFIKRTVPSAFNVKYRLANEWRLTEYRCDVSGNLPSRDFTRWPQEKNTVTSQGQGVPSQGQYRAKMGVKHG